MPQPFNLIAKFKAERYLRAMIPQLVWSFYTPGLLPLWESDLEVIEDLLYKGGFTRGEDYDYSLEEA
jgi:hypothetical protein